MSVFPPTGARPLTVRPVSTAPTACKVCGGPSPLFGLHDFNRSCEEHRGRFLPMAGTPIYYRRCTHCGLLFTDAFDDWSHEDFLAHIYNEGYAEVDPDFEATRPASSARLVAQLFKGHEAALDILDYGGGNGRMAADLREAGFQNVTTYDSFHPDHATRPAGKFNLITCIETIEHMVDPAAGAADIAALLADDGLLLLSTLLLPPNFGAVRMQWWYIGPRNGHVTIFSSAALEALWRPFGLRVIHTNVASLHLVFRSLPPFARHLVR